MSLRSGFPSNVDLEAKGLFAFRSAMMGLRKAGAAHAFYDDPVKTACDAWSSAKAYSFRSVSIETGIYWKALRWARFMARFGAGFLRQLRDDPPAEPDFRAHSSSSSSSSLSSSA
jgi:hypothetical protein